MTSTDDWFTKMKAKALERYSLEVQLGKHDECCEWDATFRMCHCHRRTRLAEGMIEAPVMIYVEPECDGCRKPCTHTGDGWECLECQVYFGDRYDEPGTWQDEYAKDDAELLAARRQSVRTNDDQH